MTIGAAQPHFAHELLVSGGVMRLVLDVLEDCLIGDHCCLHVPGAKEHPMKRKSSAPPGPVARLGLRNKHLDAGASTTLRAASAGQFYQHLNLRSQGLKSQISTAATLL